MQKSLLATLVLAVFLFCGCGGSDSDPLNDPDGDSDSSGDADAPTPDGDDDVDGDSENAGENESWDYREAWSGPQEAWSACPESELLGGMSLKDKAAYYDWIVPKLHQVPADAPGHEAYSRVFGLRCDAPVPTSIVADDQLPTCEHRLSENNGLWTSLYVASQAFRYAATGEAEALTQLRRTLNGTYQMLLITGKPGLYTRDFRDPGLPQQYCIEDEEPYLSAATDNERYARYVPPGSDMKGNQFVKIDTDGCFKTWDPSLNDGAGDWLKDTAHCTDTRFAGFCWQMNVSKDELAGHMFAAGIVAKIVDDAESRQIALDILGQVGHHLVDHNFWLNDYDGRNTRYGSAHALSMDEVPGSNALMALAWIKEAAVVTGDAELADAYYDCLLQMSGENACIDQLFETPKDYREYLHSMGLALGCSSNYDTISIAVLNYFNLIWFEEDAELRATYRDYFHANTHGPDSAGRDLWNEGDPFKNFILVSRMEADDYDSEDARKLVGDAICSLKRFHTDQMRRAQDNSDTAEWCQSQRHGSLAEQPIPVEKRCSSVFEWWGDPNEREVCAENLTDVSPPAGYLLPYWMGRYFGYIDAEL